MTITSFNQKLINNILSLPDAPMILREVNDKLKEEEKKRKDFYNAITEYEKAEFINGEIIIHSPVKKEHNDITCALHDLLSPFNRKNKLGYIGFEKVMISLTRNDFEPDLVFFSKEKVDTFDEDQVLFPAPDFVVEILSPKTAKHDRTVKLEDYAYHGIPEYWIIDPVKQRVEQYILPTDTKEYFPAKIHQYGEDIKSHAIKGFTINIAAIFDETINVKEMQRLMKKKS